MYIFFEIEHIKPLESIRSMSIFRAAVSLLGYLMRGKTLTLAIYKREQNFSGQSSLVSRLLLTEKRNCVPLSLRIAVPATPASNNHPFL
jgi:hypothetical protein